MTPLLPRPHWSQIHAQRRWNALTPFLAPLSAVYGLGVRLRVQAYRYGLLQRKRLPGFVVSIGNLTAGGTGKTPATAMLAQWAVEEGYRVAVLSRGYGGRTEADALVVSDGREIRAGWREAGDEPSLLAMQLKGVPVVVSRSRYLAGRMAHARFGSDVYILDDGFQHLALARDLDIVLLDAEDPYGNGHLLPWGPLREPKTALSRANAFVLTRSKGAEGDGISLDAFSQTALRKPVFLGEHVADKLVFPKKDEIHEPVWLQGKPIVAFAGIARPAAFEATLMGLGARLVDFQSFGDHHPYEPQDVVTLVKKAAAVSAACIVTTEKDWIRVAHCIPDHVDFAYLSIRFALVSSEQAFYDLIRERLTRSPRRDESTAGSPEGMDHES